MSNITSSEYWNQVEAIARDIVSDAMELRDNDREQAEEFIQDILLHETIDGHQWIIYYAYSLDVIEHSLNEDYCVDNFGLDGLICNLKKSLNDLHQNIAYWALYADVQDKLSEAMDNYIEALEEAA